MLPVLTPRFQEPPAEGVRVTWLGHSTVLLQMQGCNVLTDPMLSERASPSQLLGPKRFREAPCTVAQLPQLDAVVISHNHYDHLDFNTVNQLNARWGIQNWAHSLLHRFCAVRAPVEIPYQTVAGRHAY